jgi:hypothetical protein
LYSTGGALTIVGATIGSNQASGGGGGDHNGLLQAGAGGSASGAGLYATGGSLDIAASMIASNRATGGRGGDGIVTYTTHSGSYLGNGGTGGAGQGGALYVNGGSLTIASSTISSNEGTAGAAGLYGHGGSSAGGGLYNVGMLTVTGSTLSGNSATASGEAGGGIYNGGTLTVSDSTLSGNNAGEGGGIYNSDRLTVTGSTLSGNSASGAPLTSGGGISNHGTLTVTGSTLVANTTSDGGLGGGIFNNGLFNNGGTGGTVTVTGSTLAGNHAARGGGIESFHGTVTVSNSTLSGNSAYGNGGGIYTYLTNPVTLTNVTITANRANTVSASFFGGGLFVDYGAPVLHNTLIAGNLRGATGTTRDDVYGALDAGGDYNLIGDGTGMTGLTNGVNGNLIGSRSDPIDPKLGPLQSNRGPTQTMALLPGSSALNAGNPNQLGTADQRGVIRRGGVNIGAYQASATAFLISAPDTVQSGVPFDVTVTAVDIFGQVAVGYTGTVTFSTSDTDPGVVLPADYTFTAADGGVHTFTDTGLGEITLVTPGDQILNVADTTDNTINGNATITVMGGNVSRTHDRFWTDLAPSLLSADRRR